MRLWILAAAVNGLVAVAMGAYSAHGAASVLDASRLAWLDTAVRYQMWHALALLGVAAAMPALAAKARRALGMGAAAFLLGIVLFSGSLYLQALTGWRGLAWLTPTGGAALMVGWAALAWCGIGAIGRRGGS